MLKGYKCNMQNQPSVSLSLLPLLATSTRRHHRGPGKNKLNAKAQEKNGRGCNNNVKKGAIRVARRFLGTTRTTPRTERPARQDPKGRLPPSGASAGTGRSPRPPFPSARARTDLRPLPWRPARRSPAPLASPRRRLELPSGGGGAGSARRQLLLALPPAPLLPRPPRSYLAGTAATPAARVPIGRSRIT